MQYPIDIPKALEAAARLYGQELDSKVMEMFRLHLEGKNEAYAAGLRDGKKKAASRANG